jgi:hypothetical protein
MFVSATSRNRNEVEIRVWLINVVQTLRVAGASEQFSRMISAILTAFSSAIAGMDNHETHNRPDNVKGMAELEIQPIWLLLHASHFVQPLDFTLFEAFKKAHRLARSLRKTPKIEER